MGAEDRVGDIEIIGVQEAIELSCSLSPLLESKIHFV